MNESKKQPAAGADPVVVDAKHYKVVLENERVRILRIQYGPGEKSVMHYHPAAVGIMMEDTAVRFTFPDGRVEDTRAKRGDVHFYPAGDHLPETAGDATASVILVELKG